MGFVNAVSTSLGFLRRHRLKLILVVGGATALYVYYTLRQKYLLITKTLEEERTDGASRLQDGFAVSLTQAKEVLRNLLPEMKSIIFPLADTDKLVLSLKSNQSGVDRKEIWEELKIVSFSRPIACVYAIALLQLILITKFNLVGRYTSNDNSIAELPNGFLLKRTKQSYISLARRTLLSSCMEDLVRTVKLSVKDTIGAIELSKRVSGAELTLNMLHIRRAVESSSKENLRKLLVDSCRNLDANMENWGDGDNIAALLAEEADILESNDTATVLGEILDYGFEMVETLIDNELGDGTLPLPKALPKISNLATVILSDSSSVVNAMESAPLVTQFGAVVYLSGELPP
eukprot:Plantae.Rhodophyta-Purpureofilum_apyrenoidigerum.ctg7362.p1 GENE.Plantae.Rhodophyta-Purpureofilum_apyrenoidigerum.ctg7362~~Plantae.Rhodophyta-Purpureofilum_apyrenoidigerum.ctg7362.p1  ORF type:complete len:347 (-),score=68.16 Plantae.Rhodophyta-Purpureofilum_apyrenoidigerum.ctg7362:253-1293(-)